jgi:neutral ceramidase
VTIVAGLRLRRTVAAIVGAPIEDVLVTGYSNAYIHYVTTPEEYDVQRYEGGSTLFGRWELGAFMQTVAMLAEAMRDGKPVAAGNPPPVPAPPRAARPRLAPDRAPAGRAVGDVLVQPRLSYRVGEQARSVFAGAYPNNRLRRGDTYLTVERQADQGWEKVADDGDWETKLRWQGGAGATSQITITWDIPESQPPGTYRLRYFGDARDVQGRLRDVESSTRPFTVA